MLFKLFHAGESRNHKKYWDIVGEVNEKTEYNNLTDQQLLEKYQELYKTGEKSKAVNGDLGNDLIATVFAIVREVADRQLGLRHYDEQLFAAAGLVDGSVAEMGTGEGKTLAAVAAGCALAVKWGNVYIATANTYLSERDAEWMGPIYQALGLSVGVLGKGLRSEVYTCDVVYGTGQQFGFDYLADNMAIDASVQCQLEQNCIIVDEVDAVLIDEARTPLMLSAARKTSEESYRKAAELAETLHEGEHYTVDRAQKVIRLTDQGIDACEAYYDVVELYAENRRGLIHRIQNSLEAKELYQKGTHYVVEEEKVVVVDEHTGRLRETSQLPGGLQQAVEAKENVPLSGEQVPLATITVQNYFRRYKHLCGMTGTASGDAGELSRVYGLDIVTVPPHHEPRRIDWEDVIYAKRDDKERAIVDDVEATHQTGRPVLVGTDSVEASQRLATAIEQRGIPCEVLNAKDHLREAEMLGAAGDEGAVTVVTNMAGRGVDIVLGGVGGERGARVRELGGLYIIGAQRYESLRKDAQLRGRCGRQGDRGETRFYVSLQDNLLQRAGGGMGEKLITWGSTDSGPIESRQLRKAVDRVQEIVTGHLADARAALLRFDEVYNAQRDNVYKMRQQLVEKTFEPSRFAAIMGRSVESVVKETCVGEHPEDWDHDLVHGKLKELYPCGLRCWEMREVEDMQELYDLAVSDLRGGVEARDAMLGEASTYAMACDMLLKALDDTWREHLSDLEHLRQAVTLRSTAKLDPLAEWQREGHDMFMDMTDDIGRRFTKNYTRLEIKISDPTGELIELAKQNGGKLPLDVLKKLGLNIDVEHAAN